MAKKRLLSKEGLHAKAIRLVEGGAEEIDGHWVRFKLAKNTDDPCYYCMMDCICKGQMIELCKECVEIIGHEGMLSLNF